MNANRCWPALKFFRIESMNYGSAIGSDSFREALADFLYRQTKERHDVECLALTGGNSIGLAMALHALCPRSNKVKLWCEDPTYFHMRSIFTTCGLQGSRKYPSICVFSPVLVHDYVP